MTTTIVLFFLGLGLLSGGADFLVKSSSSLALRLGIRPLIIGFTIVAMGTSFPELSVSFLSAVRGTKSIALGNVIGSNIANIGLIIGLAALIKPLKIHVNTIRKEMPYLIVTTVIFYFLSLDGKIGRLDGIALLSAFFVFMGYMLRMARQDRKSEQKFFNDVAGQKRTRSLSVEILLMIAGLAALLAGSTMLVNSAQVIALRLGISEIVIGVTLVAVGTSLPELAVSCLGAWKGEVDLAVGNVVGSNLFNILFIIGFVALFFPIPVQTGLLKFDYPVMLLFAVIFLPMMISGKSISRLEGCILLVIYTIYIWLIFNK
ncbi:MAG TPA: calcium/sodium antiporter [bacterium]|nr:calcium/sodium antiporter [bacterium]HPN45821.1 calcium/sodium antiporter [bacterium]